MLMSFAKECGIFLGQNAGDEIYKAITKAQESITILSPYVDPNYAELLVQAKNRGVNVLLLTGTDFAGEKKKKDAYERLVVQTKIVNHKSKKIRLYGRIVSALLSLSTFACAYIAYKYGISDLYWALAALPITLESGRRFYDMRVYSYEYETLIPICLLVSPYDQRISENQLFVHSKIYIIDQEVMFLGSVNFTEKGFRNNYECCVSTIDIDAIASVEGEIIDLMQTDGVYYRDINFIGSLVYPEPKN